MSRGVEYLNISGLRVDGRRPGEIRRFAAAMGVFPRVDGSASVEMGNTRVLAVVHGPREVVRATAAAAAAATAGGAGSGSGAGAVTAEGADAAIIRCEYSVAPFAGADRRKRKGATGTAAATDRRIGEAITALTESFAAAMETKLYANSQIDIHIHVLQDDGAALCGAFLWVGGYPRVSPLHHTTIRLPATHPHTHAAAINAGTLALIDAGVAMRDFVVACSAAYVQRTTLLDPNHIEGTAGGPELSPATLPPREGGTPSPLGPRPPPGALGAAPGAPPAGRRPRWAPPRAPAGWGPAGRPGAAGLVAT